MANHASRGPQPTKPEPTPEPELPVLRWATIVRTEQGHHLATMLTQGGKILEQNVLPAAKWRPETEQAFIVWAAQNILDRDVNP
jgi:hypothetical protein